MRKYIARFIGLMILLAATLSPLHTHAVTPLDPGADADLTIIYQKEGQAFSGLTIRLYRVAEAFPDGTFELIAPYSSYPITIHGITTQEQWRHTAVTLSSYIVADQTAPYREGETDASGVVRFEGLETGLYLVREVIAENNSGLYEFDPFPIYLPTPQPDGSFDYSVEAKPKCVAHLPKKEYRVTKLWQDAGHQADRPKEIIVDIYKDDALWKTQILSAENNWSYVWHVSDDTTSRWTVAERSVSDSYTVTVRQNGSSFSLVNTHKSPPEIPDSPPTGDTAHLLSWSIVLCIAGIVPIVCGRRKRRL